MSVLTSWFPTPPPEAAIQIAPDAVSAAVLGGRGGAAVVQAYAVEPLPAGAVAPSFTAHNLVARPVVVDAVRTVLDRIGLRPRRVALVVPDLVGRVSLLRFDTLPARHDDLEQLVRWQVRKSAPFPIEEASLTFSPGAPGRDGGAEVVTVMARRDIVREYEGVCEELGMHAGLVDLATLAMLAVIDAPAPAAAAAAGDQLVVHVRPEYTSLVILRGPDIIFFRCRPEGDGDDGLSDLVHQTAMYYQDRLAGAGFARVVLGGHGASAEALRATRESLEQRLGAPVVMLDPTGTAALTDRIGATPDLLATLSPLVGLLARTRTGAVSA